MRYLSLEVCFCFLFSVLVAAGTNTWQGKSNEWFSGENWSSGKSPAAGDKNDVVIPGGLNNYPVLTNDAVIDGSLIIAKNATLTLSGHNIRLLNFNPSEKKGISIEGTLDASTGNPVITTGPGGFHNSGKIIGTPAVVLAGYCYDSTIKAGGTSFSSLTLPSGSYSYKVTLLDNLTITGNLLLNGHGLFIPKGVTLSIQGDLVFSGNQERNASLTSEGQVFLSGNIISNDSAVCSGGGEKNDAWITFTEGAHKIEVTGEKAILPPLLVPAGSKVRLKGNIIGFAGLKIENDGVLDASGSKQINFGGAGSVSSYSRGLINDGTITGNPAIFFSSGCYNSRLKAGTANFSGFTLDTGNYAYSVTLDSDLTINGDVIFKTGSLNMGDFTISITGSCYLPEFPDKPPVSFCLNSGKRAQIIFKGSKNAVIESGGVRAEYYYKSILPSLVVDKSSSVLTIKKAPLEVTGTFKIIQGKLETSENGEIWLGVTRDTRYAHYEIYDVGLKLQGQLTKELFPEITPASVPEEVPGVVRIVNNKIGPELPENIKLVNIAPFAKISTVPYLAMAKLLVDPDEKLRTLPEPEKGIAVKVYRYYFRFEKPQEIVAINWAVPSGPWAILADTTGSGNYNRLLRADLEGKITNPGGSWKSRAWIKNTFQPAVKNVYGILLATFGTPHYYDIQILSPEKSVSIKPAFSFPEKNIPEIKTAEAITLPAPAPEQEIDKGFHIEPWMFSIQGWLNLPKEKRPPLKEYKPFVDFAANIKKYHGNTVNMWPPRTIEAPRGKGTYEADVLWPSQYDKWSLSDNVLKEIADSFHAHGIKFFVMDRVAYGKKLEEFPPSETRDKPAPYIPRHSREYLKGIVSEEVKSGVDGVGIGFDEQMGGFRNPASIDETTKEAFQKRFGIPVPEKAEDSEAYRKWIVFGYEQFASYLAEAASSAKSINPDVFTKTPVHVCLGTLWNRRADINIAEDIVGHTANIDFFRANCYEDYANLNHFLTAANTARMLGANRDKAPDSLHNCPWADDPVKFPGYYLDTTPAWMYGPPVISFFHGGRLPLYWRYNFIFYGGYDKYVQQAYSLLDNLTVWGAKEAKIPKQILVLKSRSSEDWWQVRQRYNPEGNPLDQARGFLYEKWLLEFLLSHGYPFRIYYLDYPEDFSAEISSYPLIILPFPYSINKQAFQVIDKAVKAGSKLIIMDRQGETDEWGNFYPAPLLAEMISSEKAVFIKEDVLKTGHDPEFQQSFKNEVERLLGKNRIFSFDSFGNDVETAVLEKGPREKFILFLNWTDRNAVVQAGIKLPDGEYECFLRDLNEVKKAVVGSNKRIKAKDLEKFLVSLQPWEMKVLYIKPGE